MQVKCNHSAVGLYTVWNNISLAVYQACNLNFCGTRKEADANHNQSLMLSDLFFLVYNSSIFWCLLQFGRLNSLAVVLHVVNKGV